MKNLLKLTLSVFLLAILFVNVVTSKVSKSEQSFMQNLVVLNTANAEGSGEPVSCRCGLMWGTGCKADNHGGTCTSGDDCTLGSKNCSD
jgi:hypothetical protein